MDPIVNFFQSSIATLPVAIGATSITLQAGAGAKLPDPNTQGNFNLVITATGYAPEIVRVTGKSGDVLTVIRAQEGTVATAKESGIVWSIIMTPTKKTFEDIYNAIVSGGISEGQGNNFNLF